MRPIKSSLKTISAIVLIPLILYGSFSFIYVSIDPNVWSIEARASMIILTAAFLAVYYILENEIK